METMRRFEQAHQRRSVDGMRQCFHDDALIESVASDGSALGPDETVEALRDAMTDGMYLIAGWEYEPLAPELVLSSTTTRHRTTEGGHSHETVWRLTEGRDGLMWRVWLFYSRADALAALRHLRDVSTEPEIHRKAPAPALGGSAVPDAPVRLPVQLDPQANPA
jgi:hypothetical protein